MRSTKPQKMKTMGDDSLDAFFYPGSIAVIGAGQNPVKPNGIPLYLLSMFGYGGDVFPVNPKYERLGGLKCYPSILDIEKPVDLAVVAVPAAGVIGVLRQCALKKVRAAIIFTSGFAEVGEQGLSEQKQISELAESTGMRILGPNCLGVLNYYNGSMASFFFNEERKDLYYPHSLSFVSQSGGLGGIIYQMIVQMSIGFNYFISTGNEADVSFAEVMHYLARRDEVSIIAGYLEGLHKDGGIFIEACKKALENKKLVTLLKAGRTSIGAAAAASHTGALVGADNIYDGVFSQFGVARADDVEQINALVALHATGRLPRGKRMAVITVSGGGGVMAADKCPQYGLEVVPLTRATRDALREFFPFFGAVGNPVDLTSQLYVDPELFKRAISLVMADPAVDVGGFFYNLEMPDPEAAKRIIEVYHEVKKPLVIFTWPTGQDYAVEAKKQLTGAGVPVIEHIPSGLWAISSLAQWVQQSGKPYILPSLKPGKEQKAAVAMLKGKTAGSGAILTEWRSKQVLDLYGIAVTREILCRSADKAVEAAAEIGYPVVLKIMSPDLGHKTDAGGVILNVQGPREVIDAFETIVAGVGAKEPQARIEGVLVQEMLKPGLEVIVGTKKDPIFGPVVVLGLGGILVEVFKDSVSRVAPLREEDARIMIETLKGRALFQGQRGRPPADIDALVAVLLKVSRLAVEMDGWIDELDINPLILYPRGGGCTAADALIVPGSRCHS